MKRKYITAGIVLALTLTAPFSAYCAGPGENFGPGVKLVTGPAATPANAARTGSEAQTSKAARTGSEAQTSKATQANAAREEEKAPLEERWDQKGKDRYYLNSEGEPFRNTVILARDDHYYCFDEAGRMLRSGEAQFGGFTWEIGEDGAASVKQTEEEEALREFAAETAAQITAKAKAKTPEKKIRAIFDYVWTIPFDPEDSANGNLQEAAIRAFDLHRGNCYGRAAALHYLLQGIGIQDQIVMADSDNHWWNLVKLGDQYRHLDVTPFADFQGFFLLTTKEMEEAGASSPMVTYLHQYNQANYPAAY